MIGIGIIIVIIIAVLAAIFLGAREDKIKEYRKENKR